MVYLLWDTRQLPEGPEQHRQAEKDSEINGFLTKGSYKFFPII